MKTSGWGRYPVIDAEHYRPVDATALCRLLQSEQGNAFEGIARGLGRSYGDSALARRIISTTAMDRFLGWDESLGILQCSAGISLGEILRHFVPRGWFLPVLPGTGAVTVGGAIAADVHGKNHHRDGCFSDHVESFRLLTAHGDILECSPDTNPALFHASCAGMGLTGIILDARLRLRKVPGPMMRQRCLRAATLEESLTLLEEHDEARYSVAWLDCMAGGDRLGRSLILLGEHSDHPAPARPRKPLVPIVPFSTPAWLLNRHSIRLFNAAYYAMAGRQPVQHLHYRQYFFPLDAIHHWNRLYGRRGFLQYQLVLPAESAAAGMREILDTLHQAGKGSFLTVLKKMGPANRNLLSFPMDGYTLALDFKYQPDLLPLLDRLDSMVLHHGGRLYLAKDARMSRQVFTASYPHWETFKALREELGAHERFNSLQSRRLGL